MDIKRFNAITRVLTTVPSRRLVLRGMVAVSGGVTARWLPGNPDAESRHHQPRKKPVVRNAYGCVDVGNSCRGNDTLCCSGICQGKKPKKGKVDRSRCVGHDAGSCAVGASPCSAPHTPCTTSAGKAGFCATTTGNAAYCTTGSNGECFPCRTDADCRAVCGADAACIQCQGCASGSTCATTDLCDFSPQ